MSFLLLKREPSFDNDGIVLLIVVIFAIIMVIICIVFACYYLYRRARPLPRTCTVDPHATVMQINFMEKTDERDLSSIPTGHQDELRGYWVQLPALAFVPDAEKGIQTETSNEEGPPTLEDYNQKVN
ncbi:hypothetical protein EDD18DRAFT_1099012 [Armillaria luteobubalina]|uniref:Uncharacterized protein n=1 Tax=Armillaria luteobubalina TaxID=153913 RepID=A0AA39UUC7_9AGAR|nr:hypothetical protein EDD18DRAFT_1099012 [Armillaria luteobubalina]